MYSSQEAALKRASLKQKPEPTQIATWQATENTKEV